MAVALALFSSAAYAQDEAEAELADVPTASDEAVLGTSPLRAPPAPVAEREPPSEEPAPAEPEELGAVDEQGPWPGEPQPPVYATFWFWTAIAAVALGITACIVVALTTDAPASSVRSGLVLTF